jgi:arylsulfatase A-like enzyme
MLHSATTDRSRSSRRRLSTAGVLLALSAALGCGRPTPRNVVLVSIDTCRADALGCYGGSPAVTPHLDALAADGVVFSNVVSPVPITLPAHATILTGLSPARHGLHYNLAHLLRPEIETLAEVLARSGFVTAGFVSALVLDGRYGLDQGFGTWDDEMSSSPHSVFGAERPGTETVARALRWLEEHRSERFFLFVHLYEPHEPYQAPPEFAARFPGSPYLAEVATADAAVGELLERLQELDLDRSTLVAVVGDHGEMLGEHGEETHTYFVYQGALRVPFLLRLPHRPAVTRVSKLTGLVDVTPTVCGLLGVAPPAGADGNDLSPLLNGRGEVPAGRSLYCESLTPTRYGANPLHGLVGERWKYIRTTRPELYDLNRDPEETTNLFPAERPVAADQERKLRAVLARRTAASAGTEVASPDRETVKKFAALGYLAGGADSGPEVQPTAADPKDLVDVHVLHTKAIQLIASGRFDDAEPLSRGVLERLPDSWEANLTLGKVSVGRREWDRAIRLFERSLELKPAQSEALEGLGASFVGLGKFDRAVATLRRALPLDPEPPNAAFRLASALIDLGDRLEAERFVRLGAPMAGGKPESLLELATLLERLDRRTDAAACLERALELARQGNDPAVVTRIEKRLATASSGP